MLLPTPTLDAVGRRLPGRTPELRVVAVPFSGDPLALVRAGASLFPFAGYFGTPGRTEIGGLGVAWRTQAQGWDRHGAVAPAVREAAIPATARLLTGFSFGADGPRRPEWDGFAAASAVLPQIAVVRETEGRSRLIVALGAERSWAELRSSLEELDTPSIRRLPESAVHAVEGHPSARAWREEVADAVASIRENGLRKVVLARSVEIRAEAVVDAFGLVEELRARYPDAQCFGWQEGSGVFLGASPELLAGVDGTGVRSHPHAGSGPRGHSDEEDRSYGQALMNSDKDRFEHRLVVEDVAQRLEALTTSLSVPATPTLRRLATVQHLATTIEGVLERPVSVLEVAGALHPTPAVGGTPRVEALAFIDKIEGLDRGWYAGGIGWTAPGGDGEIAVSVRCGLLRGGSAHLFAGNGIVAASDPEAELEETRLKLQPLLDLLALA
jgi:isochorismate synthase